MTEMMRSCPKTLFKFQVYDNNEEMTYKDKRLNRTKTKHTIPLGPWAKMVVGSILFIKFIVLIFMSFLATPSSYRLCTLTQQEFSRILKNLQEFFTF